MNFKKEFIELKCKECDKSFICKNIKKNTTRQFCSIICARKSNGRNNKGKKRSIEFINKLKIKIRGKNNPFYGRHHSEETKDKIRKANKGKLTGENHPSWKGGIRTRPDGYLRYSNNDKYVHRIVMEKYIGRRLKSYEFIHHKNRNVADNRIENLEITNNSEHRKKHCINQSRNKLGLFCTSKEVMLP